MSGCAKWGKIIVVDPRIAPIARTCDSCRSPGRDMRFNGVLQLMIENDWLDHDFIDNHHFDAAEHVRNGRQPAPRKDSIAEKAIRQAAEWWELLAAF